MEAETRLTHGERRRDDDAGATLEDELDGAAAQLRAGRSEPGDRGGRELRERWIALGQIVRDMEDVRVHVDVNDAPTLEVAEDASSGDLQYIGKIGGRKSRLRAKLGAPVRDVQA